MQGDAGQLLWRGPGSQGACGGQRSIGAGWRWAGSGRHYVQANDTTSPLTRYNYGVVPQTVHHPLREYGGAGSGLAGAQAHNVMGSKLVDWQGAWRRALHRCSGKLVTLGMPSWRLATSHGTLAKSDSAHPLPPHQAHVSSAHSNVLHKNSTPSCPSAHLVVDQGEQAAPQQPRFHPRQPQVWEHEPPAPAPIQSGLCRGNFRGLLKVQQGLHSSGKARDVAAVGGPLP